MILRRDHVTGGVFVSLAIFVSALSRDLPFGTLSSPGPGMLPLISCGYLMLFGLILALQAGTGPPFSSLEWPDLPHALRIVGITAVALWLYEGLGFLLTMAALLLILLVAVERLPLGRAIAFGLGVPAVTYVLLGILLKSPLPKGPFGF